MREGTGMELLAHSSRSDLLPGPEVKAPPACRETGQNWEADLTAPLMRDGSTGRLLNPARPWFPLCKWGELQKPHNNLDELRLQKWQSALTRAQSKTKMTVCAKSLQSCPTLWDSMDCSPPGSSVHGILQASILEWVAMPSSRGSSRPRDQTQVSYVSCTGRWVLYH